MQRSQTKWLILLVSTTAWLGACAPDAGGEVADESLEVPATPDSSELAPDSTQDKRDKNPLILGAAAMACVGNQWNNARSASNNDKVRHCVATCGTARSCTLGLAANASIMKEVFDTVCKHAPANVKRMVESVSQCGGWDNADMQANARGASCALQIWQGCKGCCD